MPTVFDPADQKPNAVPGGMHRRPNAAVFMTRAISHVRPVPTQPSAGPRGRGRHDEAAPHRPGRSARCPPAGPCRRAVSAETALGAPHGHRPAWWRTPRGAGVGPHACRTPGRAAVRCPRAAARTSWSPPDIRGPPPAPRRSPRVSGPRADPVPRAPAATATSVGGTAVRTDAGGTSAAATGHGSPRGDAPDPGHPATQRTPRGGRRAVS